MVDKSTRCAIHDEVEKRHDERYSLQCNINKEVFDRVNAISAKLNWLIGAVVVLWPAVQVVIALWKGK